MFTKGYYKDVINDIKELKETIHSSPCCLEKDTSIIRQKSDIIFNLVTLIMITPVTLVFDLVLLPFELIYLILYKIIWKER